MADASYSVFKVVLKYSIFILLAPISTFFFAKLVIFQGIFDSNSVSSNVWSAIASVIVLHIALGMYIYKAYDSEAQSKSKDEKFD